MKTIEERARKRALKCNEGYTQKTDYDMGLEDGQFHGYYAGATEQKAIDHSEEHLNWIITQHYLWSYEMFHFDNNVCCNFKEWIDKAMEETK